MVKLWGKVETETNDKWCGTGPLKESDAMVQVLFDI